MPTAELTARTVVVFVSSMTQHNDNSYDDDNNNHTDDDWNNWKHHDTEW